MSEIKREGFRVMTKAREQILDGAIADGMMELTLGFRRLRGEAPTEDWTRFAKQEFLDHPLVPLIFEDPFTKHAFDRPRGYSGDADILDYMYGYRKPGPNTSQLGRSIFEFTTNTPAPVSVRERRQILAKKIDEISAVTQGTRVLSVACGHLREAHLSTAVQNREIEHFVALDQDPLSLEVVRREFQGLNVEPVCMSVKRLLTDRVDLGAFDLVYSAGLYDYLPDPVATALTARLFAMVRPGGKLIIANFAPCLRDIGYLETFMQWQLVYRNDVAVTTFVSRLNGSSGDLRVYGDSRGDVLYLELVNGVA